MDGQTHGHQLESHPISSRGVFGSGEIKMKALERS